jgi:hypothetical protein
MILRMFGEDKYTGGESLLTSAATEQEDCDAETKPMIRGLKQFHSKLSTVLESKVHRKAVLDEAGAQKCEEGFKFYIALLEWERIPSAHT